MAQKAKLAAELIRVLEQDIVSGVLKPGERLDERALSERFEVSRTPVREALQALVGSGLATTWPRRGTVVAMVTVNELVEMFEVMGELESLCARFAARRMLRDDILRLEKLYDDCERYCAAGDLEAYYEANVAFHEAIYAGARNGYLERQTKAVRNRLAPYRRLQLHRPGRMKASSAEHSAILDAIRRGDTAAASAAMQGHVDVQGAALNDLLAILPRASRESLVG